MEKRREEQNRHDERYRIDIHHYFHEDEVLNRLEAIMAKIDDDLAALLEAAQSEDTKIDSLIALTTELKARVDEIVDGALSEEQQAALDAAFAAISDNPQRIQDAIDANTPVV